MTIKLIKDGGIKILSKESGLIKGLFTNGWTELKTTEKVKKSKTKTQSE